MKWILCATPLLALALLATAEDPKPQPPADDKKPVEVTLRGEVLDLACYLAEGKKGPEHAKQAKACVKAGTPAAILTFDGQLYVVMVHGRDGRSPYEYVGEKVELQGTVVERGGVKGFIAKKTKKLPPGAGEGREGGHGDGAGHGGDHDGEGKHEGDKD